MAHRIRLLTFTFAALTGIAGCGNSDATGSGNGGGTPTTYASVGIVLTNSAEQSTLGRAQLLWDGKVIADVTTTPPGDGVALEGEINGSSGAHTMTLKIVSQTSSPTLYDVYGSAGVENLQTGETQSVTIGDGSAVSMATGQSVNYTVTFR